jgi:hypothetical protein
MSDYKNTHSKIKIICPEHGESYKIVKNILKGHGCLKCGIQKSSNKQRSLLSDILSEFKKKHGDKYDYSMFDYKNNRTPGIIICPEHGEFKQSYRTHSLGHGCPSCSGNKKLTTEDFIIRSNNIHKNRYSYDKVVYHNMHTKIKINCSKHGYFEQTPLHHIKGVGCPKCNQSKGEFLIEIFLKEKNIKYVNQKKFDGCFYLNSLYFDFYLPDYNTCIEFNGIQHYKALDIFGGEEALRLNIIRDKIKEDFCRKNGIKLIIIKQDKKHIDIKDVEKQIENIINIINESKILNFEKFTKIN